MILPTNAFDVLV